MTVYGTKCLGRYHNLHNVPGKDPDVVQMSIMNGYEVTKAIRRSSHELAKTIPIIAMTANAFSGDIQHSLTLGMNAHISKPVERILTKLLLRCMIFSIRTK